MLKLGTFFDTETSVEYDLYSMNAQTLKHAVTASYQLSALKIQMFDDDTHAIDDRVFPSRKPLALAMG